MTVPHMTKLTILICSPAFAALPAAKEPASRPGCSHGPLEFRKLRDVRTSDGIGAVEFLPGPKRFAWTGFAGFGVHICNVEDGSELRSIGGIVHEGKNITRAPGHQCTLTAVF